MIYQLVRRLLWIKTVVGIGIVALLAVFFASFGLLISGTADAILLVNFLLAGAFVWRSGARCTIFEATLPIHPRDILSAQIVSGLLLILLPALASAAFLAAGTPDDRRIAVILLEIAAILMVWVIAMNSIRLRRMSSPGLWGEIGLAAGAIAAIALVLILRHREVVAPVVFAGCAAASAALLLRMWRETPQTFEIAGREASAVKGERRRLIPSFAWVPVLREVFPSWRSVMFVGVLALMTVIGQALFALMFVGITLSEVLPPSKWIWSLPIPRMKLFLSVVLSRLGPFFAAILACLLVARAPAKVIVLALAAAALVGLLGVLWVEKIFAAALRRRSLAHGIVYGVVHVTPFFAAMIVGMMIPAPRQLQIATRVSATLPGNLAAVIAIAAAMVGALGWISYRVFCRMEPRRVPIPSRLLKNSEDLQRSSV